MAPECIELSLHVVGLIATVLVAYASGGFIVPFLLALDRVRIGTRGDTATLRGLDPAPMAVAGFPLASCAAAASVGGWRAGVVASVAAVIAWLGFRIEVGVTPRGTRIVRRALYIIPWRIHRSADHAIAFDDGWGDFEDPEALHVSCNAGATKIELGWAGRGTRIHCAELARRFNDAVATVSGG